MPRRGRARARSAPGSIALREPTAPLEGRPSRPPSSRARPPGHRDPRREDLRGVRSRELGPHLVLLARDMTGYRSLCRLVSAAHLAGTKGVPRFTPRAAGPAHRRAGGAHPAAATARSPGACWPATARGPGRRAPAGRDFGIGFFVELQHHLLPDDDWLVAELARWPTSSACRRWSPTTPTTPRPEDRELQDVLVCIRHGLTLDESAHLRRPNGEYHLKGAAELAALPPACRTRGGRPVAARLGGGDAPAPASWPPAARSTSGSSATASRASPCPRARRRSATSTQLCHDGVRRRYHPVTPAVVKQLAHELEVIERTGLAEFFLICWDLMRFAASAGSRPRVGAAPATRSSPTCWASPGSTRSATSCSSSASSTRAGRPTRTSTSTSPRHGARRSSSTSTSATAPSTPGMVCNVVTYRARSAVREVGYALGFPAAAGRSGGQGARDLRLGDGPPRPRGGRRLRRVLRAGSGMARAGRDPAAARSPQPRPARRDGPAQRRPAAGHGRRARHPVPDGRAGRRRGDAPARPLARRRPCSAPLAPRHAPRPRADATTRAARRLAGERALAARGARAAGDDGALTVVPGGWPRARRMPGSTPKRRLRAAPRSRSDGSGIRTARQRSAGDDRAGDRPQLPGDARQPDASPRAWAVRARPAPAAGRGLDGRALAVGALARAVRPDRRLPAPPRHPRRRHARHRGAAGRHRAARAGDDARPRRRPVRQARRRDDQADQARPARPAHARRDRRRAARHRARLRRRASISTACPRTSPRSSR